MNLLDLVSRPPVPEPWAEGEKIPWSEPGFSRRMLAEHLSQAHDAASRRRRIIERQVDWIHDAVLEGRASRVLDLACGPGLYAIRLARRGHCCTGIDFSPASIAHARAVAAEQGADCTYLEGDLRSVAFGEGHGLVLLVHGELNVFRREDVYTILARAHAALSGGGRIVLEPHTEAAVRAKGARPPRWYATPSGLFSDAPHVCLEESFWDEKTRTATRRYFAVDAETGGVTAHAATMQAWSDDEYRDLLTSSGFADVALHPSLSGGPDPSQPGLLALVATRP